MPTAPDEDEDDREVMLNRAEFQSRLNEFRERVRLEPEDSSITEVMNWYTSINRGLLHHLNEQIKETDSSGVWRSVLSAFSRLFFTIPLPVPYSYLVGFKNLLKSIECQNIATSFGIRYYGRGSLTAENFVSYVRYEFMARELINSTLNYAPILKAMYTNITSTKKYHRVKLM